MPLNPDTTAPLTPVVVGLDAVIVSVTQEVPRVLMVLDPDGGVDALPAGPLHPDHDRTLERALRGWIERQTGLDVGYVEQLYTFGDRFRDPRERACGRRVISVAYLALVRERAPSDRSRAAWHDGYAYLPWEDWRDGRPRVIDDTVRPALMRWLDGLSGNTAEVQRPRVEIAFGLHGSSWDPERVLDRYELLYEAGLAAESTYPDDPARVPQAVSAGRPMALDHRRILATALGRVRGKLKYRPVVFELLPEAFTLLELQRVVEALSGIRLHKQNFRRLVEQGGLVESTGAYRSGTGGRPAGLFRFRREVLRERPAPGVGVGVPRIFHTSQ